MTALPFHLLRAKGAGGQQEGFSYCTEPPPPPGLTLSALRVAGGDRGQGLHRHVQGVSALHEHHVLAGRALQKDLVGEFLGTRSTAASSCDP